MPMTVRRCTSCGSEDLREEWGSFDAAVNAGAFRANWACPSCAWPEADLVEAAAAPELVRAAPSRIPGVDPKAPVDPDEARRSVEVDFPMRHP